MTGIQSRSPVILITAVLFLGTGIGVPVHHHAHHHGDGVHISAGDHGHGTTLVQRDLRIERPSPLPAFLPVTPVVRVESAPEPDRIRPRRAPTIPRGRSPPSPHAPRAPPTHS